jgi:type I restriction enzyme M protein
VWTQKLWVYDLRTNARFTLKQNPLRRHHLDEFAELYNPENRHDRAPTWGEDNPGGRWRAFDYADLLKRDKVSLDLFWLRDESLEDSANLPDPDLIAEEIADDLEAALEQFAAIAADLRTEGTK